jgi:hypothetical protein
MPGSTMLGVVTALNLVFLLADEGRPRPSERRESVQSTLTFEDPSATKTIVVDDVFGSVEVTGGAFSDVRVSGERVVRAESAEAEERARQEVTLDMTQKGNTVEITVNGPFRCPNGSIQWNSEDRKYVVKYDLKVQVPEHADLRLKTVNDGNVVVRDVRGRLAIRNVNGRIDLERVAGSVDAQTVNGGIDALFTESPAAASQFKTVNGDVRLAFAAGLSADFALKTLNGELRSDFDVLSLPARPGEGRRENGRYVYRSDRFQNYRIGTGGPRVSMETLNGDLIVASR